MIFPEPVSPNNNREMKLMPDIDTEFFNWLVEVRRDLHMYPEISNQEKRTSERIEEILQSLGLATTRFPDITGVVGLIEGKNDGPTIALRADIDALPIQELNDTVYTSKNAGIMHACGHDASTAIMLGTARKISESKLASNLCGNIKFIFQPAEENGAGARAMIERGVLENPRVDRIVAGHMSPDIPVGKVGLFRGLGYASVDSFSLKVIGRGSHGARPEDGVDPIVAGAHFITQIQSIISRNIKPVEPAVVTVGKLISGDAANVIPEMATLEGTVRTHSEDIRKQVLTRLKHISAGLEQSFMVRAELSFKEGLPCLYNDPEVAASLYEAATAVVQRDNVAYLSPIMASEDFSFFTQARPAAIMRFGCGNTEKRPYYPLHSPYFDIDENVLKIGVDTFTTAIHHFFAKEMDQTSMVEQTAAL